jgi:hypothetical protein
MRARRITWEVQKHDPKLYCGESHNGQLWIFREGYSYREYDVDGVTLHALEPCPYYIMALTDNWSQSGQSVDWGLEPIMARLRSIDGWSRDVYEEDIYQQKERSKEKSERHFANETEAFLKEFRPQFAKAFDGINTSSMDKIDPRRKGDMKYGNRKS